MCFIFCFVECASSSLDSSLKLWDLLSGEKLTSIDVGPVDIWTVVFSPDDKFVVSGSHAGKIHLYGTESGKQEQTLDTRGGKFTLSVAYVSEFNKNLMCLKFYVILYQRTLFQSPDGKYIASGAIDGIINIFDVAYGKVLRTLEGRFHCVKIIIIKNSIYLFYFSYMNFVIIQVTQCPSDLCVSHRIPNCCSQHLMTDT